LSRTTSDSRALKDVYEFELQNARAEKEKLAKELRDFKIEFENDESKISHLRHANALLEEDLKNAQKDREELLKEVREYRSQVESQKLDVKKFSEHVQQLQREKNQYVQQVIKMKKEQPVEAFKGDMAVIQGEVEAMKEQSLDIIRNKEKFSKRVQELTNRNLVLEGQVKEINELRQMMGRTGKSLKGIMEEKEKADKAVENIKKANVMLKKQLGYY